MSWIERLNPYRFVKNRQQSLKVDALPPNLMLPLKPNMGQDIGSAMEIADRDKTTGTKAAVKRLLRLEKEDKPVSAWDRARRRESTRTIVYDVAEDEDDRGL